MSPAKFRPGWTRQDQATRPTDSRIRPPRRLTRNAQASDGVCPRHRPVTLALHNLRNGHWLYPIHMTRARSRVLVTTHSHRVHHSSRFNRSRPGLLTVGVASLSRRRGTASHHNQIGGNRHQAMEDPLPRGRIFHLSGLHLLPCRNQGGCPLRVARNRLSTQLSYRWRGVNTGS